MDETARIANYHEQMIDEGIEQRQGMLRADLDEAPCAICETIQQKSSMDYYEKDGWVCEGCLADGRETHAH